MRGLPRAFGSLIAYLCGKSSMVDSVGVECGMNSACVCGIHSKDRPPRAAPRQERRSITRPTRFDCRKLHQRRAPATQL